MTVTGKRLAAEVALASLAGLVGLGLFSIEDWASLRGREPLFGLVTRATYIGGWILSPGGFIGKIVGGCIDVAGATTNWHLLGRIEEAIGEVANMALFALLWWVLRGHPQESRLRQNTVRVVVVYLVIAIPLAIFGSMWMVL